MRNQNEQNINGIMALLKVNHIHLGPYTIRWIAFAIFFLREYVTVHDKTNHIALTIIFELRWPLPTTILELLLQQIWHL